LAIFEPNSGISDRQAQRHLNRKPQAGRKEVIMARIKTGKFDLRAITKLDPG
jgi:hypothetical protein